MKASFDEEFEQLDQWAQTLQTALEAAGAPLGSYWTIEPGQVQLTWPDYSTATVAGSLEPRLTIDGNGEVLVWMVEAPDAAFHISEASEVISEQWPRWSVVFAPPGE